MKCQQIKSKKAKVTFKSSMHTYPGNDRKATSKKFWFDDEND